MSDQSRHTILVVDDEPGIRESMGALLTSEGYEVITAENGFDALLKMKAKMPDLVISDLNMPQMSGFELLSVVRRRFPEIPVIAVSGAYGAADGVPGGVIADAFYAKGQHHPQQLLSSVGELIQNPSTRTTNHQQLSAPVWVPRNGTNNNGVSFVMLTCTQCLRSFPIDVVEHVQNIQEVPCLFCDMPVRYIIDFSVDVYSPLKPPELSRRAATGYQKEFFPAGSHPSK